MISRINTTVFLIEISSKESLLSRRLQVIIKDESKIINKLGYPPLEKKLLISLQDIIIERPEAKETRFDQISDTLLAAAAPMLLSGADPSIVWGFVILLQMYYYLLFFNIDYPSNLRSFLRIFSMGRLEFLPNPLNFILEDLDEKRLYSPPNFYNNEFSGLFFHTGGSMILIWLLILIGYLIAQVLTSMKHCLSKPIARRAVKMKEFFEWSGFLRTWTSTYFEFMFASNLQVKVMRFDDAVLIGSSFSGLIVLILNVAFPLMIYYILFSMATLRSY